MNRWCYACTFYTNIVCTYVWTNVFFSQISHFCDFVTTTYVSMINWKISVYNKYLLFNFSLSFFSCRFELYFVRARILCFRVTVIILHETVARRPAKFAKAPEHWKTLDTCCLCCRRDITSNSAFFRTFASVLISGNDSSSDTRCAWLLNSSCKACPRTETQTDRRFTCVIWSRISWFRLKINRARRHMLKRGITRSANTGKQYPNVLRTITFASFFFLSLPLSTTRVNTKRYDIWKFRGDEMQAISGGSINIGTT